MYKSQVPSIFTPKNPVPVMVFCIVSNEGHVIEPFFFGKGEKCHANNYLALLHDKVVPWMNRVASAREDTFQHDSAPARRANIVQDFLKDAVPYFWPWKTWPFDSTDLNPLDDYF